jgi:tetratricopeptide (TPR) repeat protein
MDAVRGTWVAIHSIQLIVNGSKMPAGSELTLDLSATDSHEYRIVASDGERTYERIILRELSANIREDMRLLRWKAIGLHDEGDALLTEVGIRIANLVFPPQDRGSWEQVVHAGTDHLRVRFAPGTEELLHLPWELLHLEGRFVLQHSGSHVVREVRALGRRHEKPWKLRLLHISLGVDPSLRLDEERAAILNTLPDNSEVIFLLNPPHEALEEVFARIRPDIVMISGHGAYDDLMDQHLVQTITAPIPTKDLIALAGKYGSGLLLLWTCESARLSSGIVTPDAGNKLPVDVISFTYPVRSDTAISAARQILKLIIEGRSSAQTVEAIRGERSGDDVYSFFNIVHYHTGGEPFFEVDPAAYSGSSHSAPACPGREEDLLMLDSTAHSASVTTILAPEGSGVRSLLSHWQALQSQSPFGTALSVRSDQIDKCRERPSTDRWLIVDDMDAKANLNGITQQVVRIVAPDTFSSLKDEAIVVLQGIDKEAAIAKIRELFGAEIKELIEHPLCTIPTFLEDVARGQTTAQATAIFEEANKMPERHARLSSSGRLYASLIFMMRGGIHLPHGGHTEYARHLDQLGLNGSALVAGLEECIAAKVMFRIAEDVALSPDFYLLGDKWFPNWRTENIRMFQSMIGAFARVDYEGKKLDVEMAQTLLGWAIGIREWKAASLLCIRLCSWYFGEGRLSEMEGIIRTILPHTEGEEKLILEGNLISILTSSGRFKEALDQHQALEKRVRSQPQDHEYFLNLIACLTQQVDCLVEMDRLDEALGRWQDASKLFAAWPEPEAPVKPRLLGQRANIYKESGDHESALATISEAIKLAESVPGILQAELRTTKIEILWKMDRLEEAEAELRAVAPVASGGALRSRYLHFKGLISERRRGPEWIEHVLESLEYDRQRDDIAGIAISLVTLARIFIDQNDLERAKQRLREALPYVQRAGLRSIMGVYARLWGEVAVAEGSIESAKSWLRDAIEAFEHEGQTDKSIDARQMLARL